MNPHDARARSAIARWSFVVVVSTFAMVGQAAACSKASGTPAVAIRITQPLVATVEGDNSTEIEVRHDGCVVVHYPAFDTRAGTYEFSLPGSELASLLAELDSTEVAKLDPRSLSKDLARRDAAKRADLSQRQWATSDEEVLEIAFGLPMKALSTGPALRWSGLRGQLMNHPDHPQLIGLTALRDRLLELGNDKRAKKVTP